MLSRTFWIMAVVFLVALAGYWYFNLGPGRPIDPSTGRAFQFQDAWPFVVQFARPILRGVTDALIGAGLPREIAWTVVLAGVLFAGYGLALLLLEIIDRAASGYRAISDFAQLVLAPLWQMGVSLVSALQMVEYLKEHGYIDSDTTTPSLAGFAVIGLYMIWGLYKARQARRA